MAIVQIEIPTSCATCKMYHISQRNKYGYCRLNQINVIPKYRNIVPTWCPIMIIANTKKEENDND